MQDTSPIGIGGEVFQILVPQGWKVEGGIRWTPHLLPLASAALRISTPTDSVALEYFPIKRYSWPPPPAPDPGFLGVPPEMVPQFRLGDNYLGQILLPPADPLTYVQKVFLPEFRPHVQAHIVEHEPLPEVAEIIAQTAEHAGAFPDIQVERIRLEYQEKGRWIHEDIYCTLTYYHQQLGMWSGTFWGPPETLYSFKAEKDQLGNVSGLLQTIVASARPNYRWANKYQQVWNLWAGNQMQAIHDAGVLSAAISRANDEIFEITREAFQKQQESQTRVHREFSDYIRGVETVRNPYEGRQDQVPGSYRHIWVSPQGEYFLSNQTGLDPNVETGREWTQLK